MPAMTKRVNIRTTVAVKTITPPICGTYRNVIMSTGDILKCLCKRAHVEEILPNGKTVKLNLKNYYLDNGAGLNAYHVPEVRELAKEDEPKKVEEVKETIVNGCDIDGIEGTVDPAIVEVNGEPVKSEEVVVTVDPKIVTGEEAPIEPVLDNAAEESVVETTEETVAEEVVPAKSTKKKSSKKKVAETPVEEPASDGVVAEENVEKVSE